MMEPEVQQDQADSVTVKISPDTSGSLNTISSNEQWQEVGAKVSDFIADLPAYLSEFFGEYKRPIITIGMIIASLIAVKLLLAVLSAINDLPLFSSLFELVGMGYSAWFIWRYLLKASTREQLAGEFSSLKEQVLGK
jgi:CAAD domains of cyanobacterial aminoacyl-tRNA synthetase